MVGLSDLRVLRGDVIIIRGIIGPYLAPISKFLTTTPVPGEVEDDGNGEQRPATLFTVHSERDVKELFEDGAS
jgi:hypothetical protein